jgi:hypothetical protein
MVVKKPRYLQQQGLKYLEESVSHAKYNLS